MQKLIKTLVYILATLCVFCAVRRVETQNALRLHVIANSDSAVDQAAKYAVRDALLGCEAQALKSVRSKAEAQTLLMSQGGLLQTAAEETLKKRGLSYPVQLYMGDFAFPERDYEGRVYPAGEYRALRVVLGTGAGQNWWCVMFPPLCIGEAENGEIDTETAGFKSLIAELTKEDAGKLWEKLKEKLR